MEKRREKLFSVTLKDCDVQPYRGSGAGGQKRNKKADTHKILRNLASNVLFGAIQAKPGVKAKDVITNIISLAYNRFIAEESAVNLYGVNERKIVRG